MKSELYTFTEYLKKFNLKSRSSIYNKIKNKELEKVIINNKTYLKVVKHKSSNLNTNVQSVYIKETTDNISTDNESVQNMYNVQMYNEQIVQLTHKIEILEMEIQGKNALITQLKEELHNIQIQVHALLQANVQMSTKLLAEPKKKSLFKRLFTKEKE